MENINYTQRNRKGENSPNWKGGITLDKNEWMRNWRKKNPEKEKQYKLKHYSNYGSYWHIDHIKPKSLFKYISPEDPEFQECWDLNNLQPLEKISNLKKGSNYV